jgi:PadR family transcriptional regulator, regulatory protein PadR
MAKAPDRVELLQGTLDMLILKSLRREAMHGHGIAKHIQRSSDEVLQVEHGSLYPALHRLERQGWIASGWARAATGRELKYYRLTPAGKKQLTTEESKWAVLARAIGRVLKTT